jgi:hypothetical protein
MRLIDVRQVFDAAPAEVAAAFRDPDLFPRFDAVAGLDRPEVVDIAPAGGAWRIQVRYRYIGDLGHPMVSAVVDARRLSWIEETVVDAAGSGTFAIRPDHYTKLLSCSGTIAVGADRTDAGGRAIRRIRGELSLRLPLAARPFAAPAEGAIARGLEAAVADQVPIVAAFLASTT